MAALYRRYLPSDIANVRHHSLEGLKAHYATVPPNYLVVSMTTGETDQGIACQLAA